MLQLLGTLALANPEASTAIGKSAGLRAIGATEADWDKLTTQGIPTWLMAATALVVGGVVAVRYLPVRWQNQIRNFGR